LVEASLVEPLNSRKNIAMLFWRLSAPAKMTWQRVIFAGLTAATGLKGFLLGIFIKDLSDPYKGTTSLNC